MAAQRKRNAAQRGGVNGEQDGQEAAKRGKTTKKGQTEAPSSPAEDIIEKTSPSKEGRPAHEQGEQSSPEDAPSVRHLKKKGPATPMDDSDDDNGDDNEMGSSEENGDAEDAGKNQGKKSKSQKAWDEAGEKKESEKREKIDLSQYETLANFDEESFEIKPTKVDIQKNLYLLLKYNEVELKDVKKKYRYLAINFIRESGESQFMFSINRSSLDATVKALQRIQTYLKNPTKEQRP